MEKRRKIEMEENYSIEQLVKMEAKIDSFFKDKKIERSRGYVDIIKTARELGFEVSGNKLSGNIDGLIAVDETVVIFEGFSTNKVIGYRDDCSFEDSRFIVAHELAHYIEEYSKGKGEVVYALREKMGNRSPKEQEIDYMAAALLMPRNTVNNWIKFLNDVGNAPDESMVDILSNYFKTSKECVIRRIREVVKLNKAI